MFSARWKCDVVMKISKYQYVGIVSKCENFYLCTYEASKNIRGNRQVD